MKTVLDFLPQIEKALSYGSRYTPEQMAREVLEGRAQLWQEGEGLVITQLDRGPDGVDLFFWVAAGKMEDVLRLEAQACEWGRSIGCKRATFTGRKGWEKPLAPRGWTPNKQLVFYRKDL